VEAARFTYEERGEISMSGDENSGRAGPVEQRRKEAAARALAEAEERRKRSAPPALPNELGGRKGLEPTRYGDWEKKGVVSDF
jgi:hypothetical protein